MDKLKRHLYTIESLLGGSEKMPLDTQDALNWHLTEIESLIQGGGDIPEPTEGDEGKVPTVKYDLSGFEYKQKADLVDGKIPASELPLNYVTTDTEQTIIGKKTFDERPVFEKGVQSNRNSDLDIYIGNSAYYRFTAGMLRPLSNNDRDLGASNLRWKDLYLAGNLTDGTNSVTVANVSNGLFNVINASDIVNETLTQAQFDLITNGKPTLIKGTYLGLTNPVFLPTSTPQFNEITGVVYEGKGLVTQFAVYSINTNSKVISLFTGSQAYRLSLSCITKINSVGIEQYYKTPQSSVSLSDGGTITDSALKTLIQNEQPIKLNGFTCYFSCDDGTNYQYVSTRYDSVANKNHINVITINKSTWVATFHTSDIALS